MGVVNIHKMGCGQADHEIEFSFPPGQGAGLHRRDHRAQGHPCRAYRAVCGQAPDLGLLSHHKNNLPETDKFASIPAR